MEVANVQTNSIDTQVMLKLAEVAGSADYTQLLQAASSYEQQVDSIVVDNEDHEKLAIDSRDVIKSAYKQAESLRVRYVGFPTKFVSEVNKVFKGLKESLDKSRKRVDYKILKFREKRDAEIEAAKVEYDKQQQAADGVKTCATCLSVVLNDAGGMDCHAYKEGEITVVHEGFTCDKWHHQIDGIGGLPAEGNGEPTAVQTGPPPPPEEAPNVTTTSSGSKAHTRKQWTFEVKDFEKFVRAVGNKKKEELVAEELLEIKRGPLLKLIRSRKDEGEKISVPGLRIYEEKVLV